MKILAIRIFNLASLEGLHVIDFMEEPLASSGIFAITGPTGAGKSTILDALCLALYNEAPRYESAKGNQIQIKDVDGSTISQNDSRAILRDGTGEGYSEVDFIGVDHKRYRSRWSVNRARNKPNGKLQSYVMSLINLETHQNLTSKNTETLKEIARLIGLDYNQFSKSVILAQGEFTAFLKADKDAKASLLEKLTGTEIYSEISKKIFEKYSEQKRKLEQLQDQANFIQLLSEEDIEQMKAQMSTCQEQIQTSAGELEDLEMQLKAYADLHLLEKKVQEQEQTLSEKSDLLQSVEDRMQKVYTIESFQAIRPEVQQLKKLQEQIVQQKQSLGETQKRISLLNEQIQSLNDQIKSTQEIVDLKKKENEASKPLIEKAKKLDVQIAERQKVLDKTEQEIQTKITKIQTLEEDSQKKQVNFEQLNSEKSILSHWLEGRKEKSSTVEHHQFILSKLQDAASWNKNLEDFTAQIQNLKEKYQSLEDQKEANQEFIQTNQFKLDELDQEVIQLKNKMGEIDLEKNQKKSSEIQVQIRKLNQLVFDWNQYFILLESSKNIEHKKSEAQRHISEFSSQVDHLKSLIEKEQTEFDILKKTFEKIQLETSENVASLRAHLQAEEPCLVCGSLDHPYAHPPQESTSLKILESELKELEKNLKTHQLEEVRLGEKIQQSEKATKDFSFELDSIQLQTQDLLQKIQGSEFGKRILEMEASKVSDDLKSEIDFLEKEEQKLKDLITSYHQSSKQLEEVQSNQKNLQKQLEDAQKSSSTLEIEWAKTQENLQNSKGKQEETEKLLLDVKKELSPYFSNAEWMDNWKKQPEAFVQKIGQFVEEWKKKSEQLKDIEEKLVKIKKDIDYLKDQLQEAQTQKETQNQEFLQQSEELKLIKNDRSQIFGGESTTVIEEQLQSSLKLSEEQLDSMKKDFIEKDKEQTVLDTEIKNLKNQIAHNEKEQDDTEEHLKQWLFRHEYSYSILEISQILDYSESWWKEENLYLNDLKEQYKNAEITLSVTQKNLKDHQAQFQWTIEEEVLKETYQQKKSSVEKIKEEIFRIKNGLEKDTQEKKNKASILQNIEKQNAITLNWQRINQLIGASDGKKFKTYAQEYTLEILVEYANMHLRSLSKRYLLQRIPDHLALQVIDMDMGEEVRTIYSLSGGETFLISLALALGLSSLSSKTMNVESIFIDEGFGTLDPQTLSMAMDALENLYQQGRKVGVISHVQEMTERIPVKIQVSKVLSGKSTVQIIGQ